MFHPHSNVYDPKKKEDDNISYAEAPAPASKVANRGILRCYAALTETIHTVASRNESFDSWGNKK